MQDWRYAGKEECRKGGTRESKDLGQWGCRTGRMQYMKDAVQERFRTGGMQDRFHSGQV